MIKSILCAVTLIVGISATQPVYAAGDFNRVKQCIESGLHEMTTAKDTTAFRRLFNKYVDRDIIGSNFFHDRRAGKGWYNADPKMKQLGINLIYTRIWQLAKRDSGIDLATARLTIQQGRVADKFLAGRKHAVVRAIVSVKDQQGNTSDYVIHTTFDCKLVDLQSGFTLSRVLNWDTLEQAYNR